MKLTEPGSIYLGRGNEPFVLQSYCEQPTATMEAASTGDHVGGSIHSLNLAPFRPIDECSFEEIRDALKHAAQQLQQLRRERDLYRERLDEALQKLNALLQEKLEQLESGLR